VGGLVPALAAENKIEPSPRIASISGTSA
jgi:hypothetical protein